MRAIGNAGMWAIEWREATGEEVRSDLRSAPSKEAQGDWQPASRCAAEDDIRLLYERLGGANTLEVCKLLSPQYGKPALTVEVDIDSFDNAVLQFSIP